MLSSQKQKEVLNDIRNADLNKTTGQLYEELYPDQVAFGDFLQCLDAVRNEREKELEDAEKKQAEPETQTPKPEKKAQ